MNIFKITSGPADVNTYILSSNQTGKAIVIDPGDSAMILDCLADHHLTCGNVLLTHGHFDHIAGISGMIKQYDPDVYIHKKDLHMLRSQLDCGAVFFGVPIDLPDISPKLFSDHSELMLDGIRFRIIHTPGHTEGSSCFAVDSDSIIFTGDTLFCRGFGRTDLPFAEPEKMMGSLIRLLSMDCDLTVYPGHGPSTTICKERALYI